jgi:hypothetical protein
LGSPRRPLGRPANRDGTGLVVFIESSEFAAPTTDVRELRDALGTRSTTPTADRLAIVPEIPDGDGAVEAFEEIASRGISAVGLVTTGWSLRWRLSPGAVVAVRDHVNLGGVTPLVGWSGPGGQFVHVDGVYRSDLRRAAAAVARQQGWELHEGVYARMNEPLPPTSVEGRWLRGLGVDLVGSQLVAQSVVAAKVGLGVLALVVVAGWAGVSGPPGEAYDSLTLGRQLVGGLLPAMAAMTH